MKNKIYNFSPEFIKQILVFASKTFRRFLFIFGHNKFTCEKKDLLNLFQMQRRYGPLKHFCYAPYTSMFFSLHGKMAPCYATYNGTSDVYSKNKSIRESWFNGSFAEIRKEHSKCNYSENCKFCEELFKNKAYGSMLMQKYEHYAFSKSNYPKIMEFELSNKCNLECIMCDSNLSSAINKRENHSSIITENYGSAFIEELKEFIPHLQTAEFTGGDPFLIEIYYQIWDMIIEMNPKCCILITTNANCMNERIKRLLDKSTNISFNISFDSVSKNIYESIRINGNYDKAIENINFFNAYCKKNKTSLNLMVCPMTINRFDLPKIVEYANKIKVGIYFHTVVKPKNVSLKYQTSDYLEDILSYLKDFNFPKNNRLQKINSKNYNFLIQLIETWKEESLHEKESTPSNNHPINIIYNRLNKLNDTLNIEKAKKIILYFEERKQIENMYFAFRTFDAEKLFLLIQSKSYEDIIIYIGEQINKKCKHV